jgi:Big-like domain-containing protein
MFNESRFNCFDGDIISVQGFLSQSDFTTPSSDPGPPGGGTVGPPSATETSPTDGATDIVLNAVVTFTFNRQIDPASVTNASRRFTECCLGRSHLDFVDLLL